MNCGTVGDFDKRRVKKLTKILKHAQIANE